MLRNKNSKGKVHKNPYKYDLKMRQNKSLKDQFALMIFRISVWRGFLLMKYIFDSVNPDCANSRC